MTSAMVLLPIVALVIISLSIYLQYKSYALDCHPINGTCTTIPDIKFPINVPDNHTKTCNDGSVIDIHDNCPSAAATAQIITHCNITSKTSMVCSSGVQQPQVNQTEQAYVNSPVYQADKDRCAFLNNHAMWQQFGNECTTNSTHIGNRTLNAHGIHDNGAGLVP